MNTPATAKPGTIFVMNTAPSITPIGAPTVEPAP